jgi:hypothetical protein
MNWNNFLDTCQTGDLILFSDKKEWYSRAIEFFTGSKFSHVAMILKSPIYINPELTGIYILESGYEDISACDTGKITFGVQISKIECVKNTMKNAKNTVYYRKLDLENNTEVTSKLDTNTNRGIENVTSTTRDIEHGAFNEKVKIAYNIVKNKPYDIDPIDWIKAEFHLDIGNVQKTNTFWCSALVACVYVKMGLLEASLPWTIIEPKFFSFYENPKVKYNGCVLHPEVRLTL